MAIYTLYPQYAFCTPLALYATIHPLKPLHAPFHPLHSYGLQVCPCTTQQTTMAMYAPHVPMAVYT